PKGHLGGTAAFYRAMSLFRLGKRDEAEKLARLAAATMRPLPKDEKNPLADQANADDLILWLGDKGARALVGFDAPPPRGEDLPPARSLPQGHDGHRQPAAGGEDAARLGAGCRRRSPGCGPTWRRACRRPRRRRNSRRPGGAWPRTARRWRPCWSAAPRAAAT